jgi:hypothetical protein
MTDEIDKGTLGRGSEGRGSLAFCSAVVQTSVREESLHHRAGTQSGGLSDSSSTQLQRRLPLNEAYCGQNEA